MKEGDMAPDFELPANDGSVVKLDSYQGKKNVVLCFYPKNHLFACPSKKIFKMAEATIRAYPQIKEVGSELFAISIDTVEDQKKFVEEYKIPYLHLSDMKKTTCKTYAGLNLAGLAKRTTDRKSTRLNSSHSQISYAVFCLKKKKTQIEVI